MKTIEILHPLLTSFIVLLAVELVCSEGSEVRGAQVKKLIVSTRMGRDIDSAWLDKTISNKIPWVVYAVAAGVFKSVDYEILARNTLTLLVFIRK